jgi:hypothetical protein
MLRLLSGILVTAGVFLAIREAVWILACPEQEAFRRIRAILGVLDAYWRGALIILAFVFYAPICRLARRIQKLRLPWVEVATQADSILEEKTPDLASDRSGDNRKSRSYDDRSAKAGSRRTRQ